LGGGGARGFFHMGVIKALQELNIRIDEIAGTSIGAIIGVIYAANPKIDFEKMANELDFLEIFKILALVKTKDINKNIEEFFKKYVVVENFDDLKIKCRFNATDINQKK
jgi:NTE family protein